MGQVYSAVFSPDGERIALPNGVDKLPESGTFWIGQQGSIFKNYRGGKPILLPEDKFRDFKRPDDAGPPQRMLD